MKKLRIIEPVVKEKEKLRVAAYCRVSTKLEGQQSSIDLQKSHYEAVIQGNPASHLFRLRQRAQTKRS